MTLKNFRKAGHAAYSYIAAHPGVTIAQVDRAVRTARGGHSHMYNTVHRLITAGYVRGRQVGGRYALEAVS